MKEPQTAVAGAAQPTADAAATTTVAQVATAVGLAGQVAALVRTVSGRSGRLTFPVLAVIGAVGVAAGVIMLKGSHRPRRGRGHRAAQH